MGEFGTGQVDGLKQRVLIDATCQMYRAFYTAGGCAGWVLGVNDSVPQN